MTDTAWIGRVLLAARPQAVAALLRTFRNLDMAEEAFQEASLRALKASRPEAQRETARRWETDVGWSVDGVHDEALRARARRRRHPPAL